MNEKDNTWNTVSPWPPEEKTAWDKPFEAKGEAEAFFTAPASQFFAQMEATHAWAGAVTEKLKADGFETVDGETWTKTSNPFEFPSARGQSVNDVWEAVHNSPNWEPLHVTYPRYFYHTESDDAIKCDNQAEYDSLMKAGEDLQELTEAEYRHWVEMNNNVFDGDDATLFQAIEDAGYKVAFTVEPAKPDDVWIQGSEVVSWPTQELPFEYSKPPEPQQLPTDHWPADNTNRYFIGYRDKVLYVLLAGPYDTIEECQIPERVEQVWQRFVGDASLSFPFPNKDRARMTEFSLPFAKAIRKGSYGRI